MDPCLLRATNSCNRSRASQTDGYTCFWQTGYVYWNTTFIIFWNLNHKGAHRKILSWQAALCVGDKEDWHLFRGSQFEARPNTGNLFTGPGGCFSSGRRGKFSGSRLGNIRIQSLCRLTRTKASPAEVARFTAVVAIRSASRVLTEPTGHLDIYRKYRVTQK